MRIFSGSLLCAFAALSTSSKSFLRGRPSFSRRYVSQSCKTVHTLAADLSRYSLYGRLSFAKCSWFTPSPRKISPVNSLCACSVIFSGFFSLALTCPTRFMNSSRSLLSISFLSTWRLYFLSRAHDIASVPWLCFMIICTLLDSTAATLSSSRDNAHTLNWVAILLCRNAGINNACVRRTIFVGFIHSTKTCPCCIA